MNFEVILTKQAEIELHEIFIWYENQSTNLGFRFVAAFEGCLNKINLNPYYASIIEHNARSASLKSFPYEIIYRLNAADMQIRIIAIVHQHRNPVWIKRRLGE